MTGAVRKAEKSKATVPAEAAELFQLSRADIDLDILPELLGYQLRRAQVRVFNSFLKRLDELDVSPGEFGLLVLVGANPGLNQNALAKAIGSNRSLLVPMLDKLEARGLVAREKSAADRRSHAVVPSRAGQLLITRLKGVVRDHERQVTTSLSDEERQTLLRLLCRLNGQEAE
ncbi:MAG TPA: MarR family transcriptional regulator [Aliidongia sp.]|uniref:MarR family winged helix-turn-helix transcriptional regulator n=1 Tax=Aliidongia sp. TaxID=1914230 RepID=UPI002DDC958F|nr:MarR family transcriptional regulator [Aliidongia sp.]HEV2673458.1 MarR family transcriptional regulator [Aliidongia sp.]